MHICLSLVLFQELGKAVKNAKTRREEHGSELNVDIILLRVYEDLVVPFEEFDRKTWICVDSMHDPPKSVKDKDTRSKK